MFLFCYTLSLKSPVSNQLTLMQMAVNGSFYCTIKVVTVSYSLAEYKAELTGFCYFLYIKSPIYVYVTEKRSHFANMELQPVWKFVSNLESNETSPSYLAQKITEFWDFKNGIWKSPFWENGFLKF